MRKIPSIARLIDELIKLPTIGRKTAERLSFSLLMKPKEDVIRLADALRRIKEEIIFCSECNNIAQFDPCHICDSPQRDKLTLCVVEETHDVFAFEKTREYKGLYHVLQGVLSPLDGIGPNDLKIAGLIERVKQKGMKEVIIATNPTMEGETTAMYVAKLLKPLQVKVTRIARGLPVGGDMEYADEATLMKSLEGRMEF